MKVGISSRYLGQSQAEGRRNNFKTRENDLRGGGDKMVNSIESKQLIYAMAEKIKKEYGPEKIILFGSYAWGQPEKDSDVDLFIIKETNQKHRQRMLTVRRLLSEENSLVGMDILVYTPQEVSERLKIGDSFISKILNKGDVLYG